MFSCNLPPARWQNDRDLLRATAETRGWNGYRNKIQHRKLILEKKIFQPLQPGLKPATFRPRVRRSIAEPSSLPTPLCYVCSAVSLVASMYQRRPSFGQRVKKGPPSLSQTNSAAVDSKATLGEVPKNRVEPIWVSRARRYHSLLTGTDQRP